MISRAESFVKFLTSCPTPYHVVNSVTQKLKAEGFSELSLNQKFDIQLGGKYYLNLNNSMIMAFAVGKKFKSENGGFTIVASHTDSPCFRLKPNSIHRSEGFDLLGVQMYGGGIWHTWIDRDLSIAGIVYFNENNAIKSKLLHIDQPLFKIPELAIHLNRKVNETFGNNSETFFVPIVSLSDKISSQHNPTKSLIGLLADIKPENILGYDMLLIDSQPATIGGIENEFIFSGRLDNLLNVYASSESFIESLKTSPLDNEDYIRMILCYDNEEVGSESYQGAGSQAIPNILKKICECLNCDFLTTISNSIVISADQAHADHPNVPGKHELMHSIDMAKGVVMKENSNQKYATTAFTTSVIELVAQKNCLPIQRFVIRNDLSCGSTVGPIMAHSIGVKVVDVGFPMLSMHSVRETCASISVSQAIDFYLACFKDIPSILNSST